MTTLTLEQALEVPGSFILCSPRFLKSLEEVAQHCGPVEHVPTEKLTVDAIADTTAEGILIAEVFDFPDNLVEVRSPGGDLLFQKEVEPGSLFPMGHA